MSLIPSSCVEALTNQVMTVAGQDIANALSKRMDLSGVKEKLALAADTLVLVQSLSGAVQDPSISNILNNLPPETKQAIATNIIGARNKVFSEIKQLKVIQRLGKLKSKASSMIDNNKMINGFKSTIGKSFDTIKSNKYTNALLETSMGQACLDTAIDSKVSALMSKYPAVATLETTLSSMDTLLQDPSLMSISMASGPYMSGLNNEGISRALEVESSLNSIVSDKGMDNGFNQLATNVQAKLPSSIELKGLENIPGMKSTPDVSLGTIKNVLVDMGSVPQQLESVDMLADTKLSMQDAILSLKKEGSLVTSQTVLARYNSLNGTTDMLPPGLTESNVKRSIPTMLSNITTKTDVLKSYPALSKDDGYKIAEESIKKNIKSPQQVLQETIAHPSDSMESAVVSVSRETTSGESVSGQKEESPIKEEEVVVLQEAKEEQKKASKSKVITASVGDGWVELLNNVVDINTLINNDLIFRLLDSKLDISIKKLTMMIYENELKSRALDSLVHLGYLISTDKLQIIGYLNDIERPRYEDTTFVIDDEPFSPWGLYRKKNFNIKNGFGEKFYY